MSLMVPEIRDAVLKKIEEESKMTEKEFIKKTVEDIKNGDLPEILEDFGVKDTPELRKDADEMEPEEFLKKYFPDLKIGSSDMYLL